MTACKVLSRCSVIMSTCSTFDEVSSAFGQRGMHTAGCLLAGGPACSQLCLYIAFLQIGQHAAVLASRECCL